jgi:hypothetical protein
VRNAGAPAGSYFQDVAFTCDRAIEHWVDEEAEEHTRNQSGDDDDRERLLGVGPDAGGERSGQQSEAEKDAVQLRSN